MIVDSHTHIASADRKRYPLSPTGVGSEWFNADDVGINDLVTLAEGCGVSRIVVVQGIGAYKYDCSYAVDSVRDDPERLRLVGAIDMNGVAPEAALLDLARTAGMHLGGIRMFGVSPTPPSWLMDGRAEAVWRLAGELGITVVPTLFPDSLPILTGLLERYPTVPVVLEHMGFVDLSSGAPFPKAKPLFDLARFPSVNIKVTTHSLEAAEAVGDPADLVDHLVKEFGSGRLVWGSDYPQSAQPYSQMLALVRHATRRLASEDRDLLMGGTASRLWWPSSDNRSERRQ